MHGPLLFHDIGKKATAEASTQGRLVLLSPAHESVGATIFYENYGSKAEHSILEFSRKESDAITWVTLFHLGKFWDSKKFKKVAAMVTDPNFDLLCSVAYFDSSMRIKGERFAERMEYLGKSKRKLNLLRPPALVHRALVCGFPKPWEYRPDPNLEKKWKKYTKWCLVAKPRVGTMH